MFTSVHCCTGDLAFEILILTFFGNLSPDSQPVSRYRDHDRQGNNPNKTCGRICCSFRQFSRSRSLFPPRSPFTIHRCVSAIKRPNVYCSLWENEVSRESGSSNWFKSILISIYLLELVGASAITALGCVACNILQIDWSRSAPLWFAGYLFVYNADRLYLDPADRLNLPLRSNWGGKLRGCRVALIWLSVGILAAWPPATGRFWLLFPLAVAFGILCFYSRPIPGTRFRLKDLPYLKSLLAPAAIAIILVPWPALESGNVPQQKEWLIFVWIFLILSLNALVFDYRDIAGDRFTGTRTIPVLLGHRRTRGLLMLLAGALVGTSIGLYLLRLAGPIMPVVLTLGCAVLMWSLQWRIHPALLSALADILLFLPIVGEWWR